MEHCYRIALWMFCFIAGLQAIPLRNCSKHVPTIPDLLLKPLRNNVSCGNMEFLSQSNHGTNYNVPIKCFYNELVKASENCTNSDNIYNTLDALEDLENCTQSAATSSSDCPWQERKPFTRFVDDLQDFIEELRQKRNI